ncbi:MAG: sensory rhodopsin transducer [Geminicoccaceae bacterium]
MFAAAWTRRPGSPSSARRADHDRDRSDIWAVAEGYIPASSTSSDPKFVSHETICLLNAGDRPAQVEVTLYFAHREPVGPYKVTVDARRTLHLRFNDLADPEPVPRDTDYASVIRSDVPIVVQHTRLDSRRAELALLSTVAYPA